MSRRARRNDNTFVNNVRGPTSALTSFLNERGIRRANPAPRPAEPEPDQEVATASPEASDIQGQENQHGAQDDSAMDVDEVAPTSSTVTASSTRIASIRAAAIVARAQRRTTLEATAAQASSSKSVKSTSKEEESSSSSSDDDNVVAIPVPTRSRRAAAVAATAKVSTSKKRSRGKKGDNSDDTDDDDFEDITGKITRSKFSHKGRMPQGSNKIEFCSNCRARFTIKAGTVPATDENDRLLCQTCSGEGSSSAAVLVSKPKKKVIRRKAQKAAIECKVPTLQDLCIQKIAECIEDVEAFGDISDISLDKICKIISRNRSLSTSTVGLFMDSRHTGLSLYDCTTIEEHGLKSIAQLCPMLKTLTLIYCGRMTDDVIKYYADHLQFLNSLTLCGAFLVSTPAFIHTFETMGSRLLVFDFEHTARLKEEALEALVNFCPNVEHVKLGECSHMTDAWLGHLSKLTKLKVLGLQNPGNELSTAEVLKLIQAVGSGLEILDLTGNRKLEDSILVEGIKLCCPRLQKLNITECEGFTSEAVTTLFSDWKLNRGLTELNLFNCVMLKDEALLAIVSHSSETLEFLNLNGLDELTREGLEALWKCEELALLDVSWCRAMDDEIMEGFCKSNLKLTLVTVWGDHRLTECCPTRKGLRVIGREGDYVDLRFGAQTKGRVF